MKAALHNPNAAVSGPATVPAHRAGAPGRRGRLPTPKASRPRAHQKAGGYKRVEIFLGVEAAIALRQLMRDGRSARDVIEELLLRARERRRDAAAAAPRET